ncbi:RraA family protein [Alcaligenaceae bacterium]|nr:RraA family protein [Alcaligenaceae bacterium]
MINSDFERLDAATVAAYADIPTTIVADVAGRRGALDARVRTVVPGLGAVGTAFTVEVRPGDNLMIHAALMLARPGDILVVDGKADTTSALMGELMCAHAAAAGILAVVIDGAVRDSATLRQGRFPVFATGVNANGPTRTQGGRIGHPVSVGGVSVAAGDLVVCDDDGVVIVPRQDAAGLLNAARAKITAEAVRLNDIQEGRLLYGWLEGVLKTTGELPSEQTIANLIQRFQS